MGENQQFVTGVKNDEVASAPPMSEGLTPSLQGEDPFDKILT